MDILENAKAIAKDTLETVVKKSGEVVDATKTKYTIFELKNDIKKLYSEIGRLTYLAMSDEGEYSDDIKLKCDIVQEKLAKIKALELGDL